MALFLLFSALPWTKVWGGAFKQAQAYIATHSAQPDWTTGPSSEHALHRHERGQAAPSWSEGSSPTGFDAVTPHIAAYQLAGPVLVTPPSATQKNWLVRSASQNRTARRSLELDPQTLAVVKQGGFSEGSLVDRVIAIGISAHEGQLFGPLNQILGVVTAIGLLTLSGSILALWWQRRPAGLLGAPPPDSSRLKLAPMMAFVMLLPALFLPMFGVSLLVVLALEHLLLRRIERIRVFLGLRR
jgi:uncharacterized iron-regulated membrane protein